MWTGQSWTRAGFSGRARVRAGFGPGSGRDFQIFPADIRHVNAKYFLSFFFYFCCIFDLNLYSVASTRFDYFLFILQ